MDTNKILLIIVILLCGATGYFAYQTSQEVKEIFKDEVGYVFEGSAKGGVPSTIIDLTGKEVKIYREGNIKLSSILKVIEEEC
jgi:tRNA A37 threonylcarbamoyladenosine synthetase subunit TsaC/SUA5/YrdC